MAGHAMESRQHELPQVAAVASERVDGVAGVLLPGLLASTGKQLGLLVPLRCPTMDRDGFTTCSAATACEGVRGLGHARRRGSVAER
jgi:hypothetical protein